MKFDSAGLVEAVVRDMQLADLPRAENRAVLNRLYNGDPPYRTDLADQNNIDINRNFLEGPNLLAQARRQCYNAFQKPGNFFTVHLDSGSRLHRQSWSHKITKGLSRALKQSAEYGETLDGQFANFVIHGPGPVNWPDRTYPIPDAIGVEDLLIPAETLRSFKNLQHFAIFRQLTATQLYEITHGPKRMSGWNMPLVDAEIDRIKDEFRKGAYSQAYDQMPEKIDELIKQDGGFWGSDCIPTIDLWDFYFRETKDDGKGWYRRIILDNALSTEGKAVYLRTGKAPEFKARGQFLFTSGNRSYAKSVSEIIHCQFGDVSAVAPFRYRSVRSLGWMLWGVCDLMNRYRCRFSESAFQQLMWFFRCASEADIDRLKKVNFTDLAVIPNNITWVPQAERPQPNATIIQEFLQQNRGLMSENAASFTQETFSDEGRIEETATKTMARVQSVNAMVGAMLQRAYNCASYQYREICRRFCIANSPHQIVRKFRLEMLKDEDGVPGVPPELLDVEKWDIEPDRVLGGGNKVLEIAQAEKLMAARPLVDPDSQREITYLYFLANTDDAALAERLAGVNQKQVTDSMHDAQQSVATILKGLPVPPKRGLNPTEIIETWLAAMALELQKITQAKRGQATVDDVIGLNNLAQHISQQIQLISGDSSLAEKVRKYTHDLKVLMQLVKRLQPQQQQGPTNGDAETATKLQGKLMLDQAKAENTRRAHLQKTQQRQVQWELGERRKEQEHQLDMRRKLQEQQVDDAATDMRTAAEIRRGGLRAFNE